MPAVLHNIPANILSGFLGTGKTTAILKLFQQKPKNSKWAVLVNEFGEIGIDGSLYQAENISVREIPGGCMCCAQGLPLQVAVNQLLRQARPDRLLIESSGVGHPSGVLKTLSGEGFNKVLTLRAGICLIDPMHLLDERYHHNALFLEQIQLADVLVANKTDIASTEAMQAFQQLANKLNRQKALITETTHAELKPEWLDLPHNERKPDASFRLIAQDSKWQSHSFRFSDTTIFDHDALLHWLQQHKLMRVKGVINTTQGRYTVNATEQHIQLSPITNDNNQSCLNVLEVIDNNLDAEKLQQSMQCCYKQTV